MWAGDCVDAAELRGAAPSAEVAAPTLPAAAARASLKVRSARPENASCEAGTCPGFRVSIKAHRERDAGRTSQQAPGLVGSELELPVLRRAVRDL